MIKNIWGLKCWCYFCEILVWKRRKKTTYKHSSWLLFYRIYLHFTFLEKKSVLKKAISTSYCESCILKVTKFETRVIYAHFIFYMLFIVLYMYVQSVPITTKVVSSNPAHSEVHLIQHYVIKFVSDLQQVGGFLWVLWFPPPIKLTITI